MEYERMELIDRLVGTNESEAFDEQLYVQVYYAIANITGTFEYDQKLIDPTVRMCDIRKHTMECIRCLHYILEVYPVEMIERIVDEVEFYNRIVAT